MLLSLRKKKGLTSLFKEVRVFKVGSQFCRDALRCLAGPTGHARHLYGKRVCTPSRHTNDTHALPQTLLLSCLKTNLRTNGALVREPRVSTPCDMRFFPNATERTAIFREVHLKMAIFPVSRGKIACHKGRKSQEMLGQSRENSLVYWFFRPNCLGETPGRQPCQAE